MDVEQHAKLVGSSSELQKLKRAVTLAYALIGVLFLSVLGLLIALAVVGSYQGHDIEHLQSDYNVAPNVSFRSEHMRFRPILCSDCLFNQPFATFCKKRTQCMEEQTFRTLRFASFSPQALFLCHTI